MPTLRELETEFIKYTGNGSFRVVDDIAEAQGVWFLCPLCFVKNAGSVGTHHVLCWSRTLGVPDDAEPGPGRWTLHGTGIDDLTLEGDPVGTARSVDLSSSPGGCKWHGHVTNGVAE